MKATFKNCYGLENITVKEIKWMHRTPKQLSIRLFRMLCQFNLTDSLYT